MWAFKSKQNHNKRCVRHYELEKFLILKFSERLKIQKTCPHAFDVIEWIWNHTGMLCHPPTLWGHSTKASSRLRDRVGTEPHFLSCPKILLFWACPAVASPTPLYWPPRLHCLLGRNPRLLWGRNSAIRLNIAGRGCISFGLIILSPIRRTKNEEFSSLLFSIPFNSLGLYVMGLTLGPGDKC